MMKRIMNYLGVLLVVLPAFYLTTITLSVYRFSQQDQAVPADAAVVLGAAVFRNRPSPVFRERINHAIGLYEQGLVDKIIFTGGLGSRDTLTEAEVAGIYAQQQGVPPEAILLETTSTNTQENLTNAQAIGTANGIESYIIVSTPSHMKRAVEIAGNLQMQAYSSPTRTIRWISWRTQSRAFLREVIAYGVYVIAGSGN
jgi:uncharacterized SAM-binding protein YcdF (DUF218 family)